MQLSNYICKVKQKHHIYGFILLAAIYSFALAMVSTTTSTTQARFYDDSTGDNTSHVSAVNKIWFGHLAEDQTVISYSNTVNGQAEYKHVHPTFYALHASYNNILHLCFKHYIANTKQVLISKRNTDIIFPFHYFW